MCGIAGFAGQGNREILERMVAAVGHRGPDGRGFFLSRDGVGLGHARLAIIDLSPSGEQPMASADGSVQVILNGEIYNFRELRRELEQKGAAFRSQSDTEVITHLYAALGEEVFSCLNGMFAVALYDSKRRRLILARDRLGKKPLYWADLGGALIFGSEIKALMAHPSFRSELDLESVNAYLLHEHVPTPRTIFKGVRKLEPASYLVWENGACRVEKFWQPRFRTKDVGEPEALERLNDLLAQSVRDRLVADVPLGILLSGGLDSSTIAYYAQQASGGRIKSFSIGFAEASFDESAYASAVAKHLGTDHHHVVFTARDALRLIPDVAEFTDEPLADASIIPTYLLSRFARQSVTVALGGDGGDELFAGYPTFLAERFAPLFRLVPALIRRHIIAPLADVLPASGANFSLGFRLRKFIAGFEGDDRYRHLRWLGSFDRAARSELFRPEVWRGLDTANEFAAADRWLAEAAAADSENRLLYLYLRTYLMDEVLVKVDRASMRHALEVRAPFLDHRVVDFMLSLPYRLKCRGFSTKYLLKRLMADRLPAEVVRRPKKGFGIPLARWLRRELRPFCEHTLSETSTKRIGLFNYGCIRALKEDHFAGRRDNRKPLWTLISFYLWHERWMARPPLGY